jgi:membrane associated rhomboid family serine protease
MIPLRDSIPNVRPCFAVWGIMALNTLAFVFQQTLNKVDEVQFSYLFGVVPARYTGMMGPLSGISWTGSTFWDLVPFVTYMFLHGGWLHFLLNMWVLWIFADNIEDVMGSARFVLFYLLCGVAALALHIASNPASTVPIIGASGAIGGVMGAYILLYPHGRIVTFIPLLFIPYFIEIPAVLFLGIWFATQLLSGLGSQVGVTEGGVAFWAHVGGFLAGMLFLWFFRLPGRCVYCYNRSRKRYEQKD